MAHPVTTCGLAKPPRLLSQSQARPPQRGRVFVLCHFTPTTRRTTMDATSSALVLILITLVAGTVNGALGSGFSSITVPVALLFYANRVLNPALVWVEVVL